VLLHIARSTEQVVGKHPFAQLKVVSPTELALVVGVMSDAMVVYDSVTLSLAHAPAWANKARVSLVVRDTRIVARVKPHGGVVKEVSFPWTSSGNYVRFAFSAASNSQLDTVRCLAVGGIDD